MKLERGEIVLLPGVQAGKNSQETVSEKKCVRANVVQGTHLSFSMTLAVAFFWVHNFHYVPQDGSHPYSSYFGQHES